MPRVQGLSLLLPLLGACTPEASGTATLDVTPVNAEASERADTSSFDVTASAGEWSETQTVPVGGEASFEVPAGEVHVEAAGSWTHYGGDTGGEGCECTGAADRTLEGGEVLALDLPLACDECWID